MGIGETTIEKFEREMVAKQALKEYFQIAINQPLTSTGIKTPGGLGLNLNVEGSGTWLQDIRTEQILSRLPQTPVHIPAELLDSFKDWSSAGPSGSKTPAVAVGQCPLPADIAPELVQDTNEWKTHLLRKETIIPEIKIEDVD